MSILLLSFEICVHCFFHTCFAASCVRSLPTFMCVLSFLSLSLSSAHHPFSMSSSPEGTRCSRGASPSAAGVRSRHASGRSSGSCARRTSGAAKRTSGGTSRRGPYPFGTPVYGTSGGSSGSAGAALNGWKAAAAAVGYSHGTRPQSPQVCTQLPMLFITNGKEKENLFS